MAREVAAGGRTVFMSSHVMSEVQKAADRVGIIRQGVLVAVAEVASLLESSARRVEIVFAEPVDAAPFQALEGLSELDVHGRVLRCRLTAPADALVKQAARHTVMSLTSEEPDLEDLFFTRYSEGAAAAAAGESPTREDGAP